MMEILEPYVATIKICAVAALIAGLLLIGYRSGSRHVQAKWDEAKVVQMQAAAKAESENRAKEQSWSKRLEEAQNEAKERENKLRADADAARDAADGLREQLANTKRQLSTATADASRRYAEALSDVFSQCAARYASLARNADECESDKQTLMDAWPK